MKKWAVVALLLVAAYLGLGHVTPPSPPSPERPQLASGDAAFAAAFDHKTSNVQLEGRGTVVKILRDDTQGVRHQKFLVRLGSGQVVLIAHNLDLAPRVTPLTEGDRIGFFGEYEWSDKGGVVHWTHDDPRGRHAAGWIEHDGRRFH